MSVLVTGGAGYIGAHAVRELLCAGREVVVVDDLSSGHRASVPPGVPLLEADVGDTARIAPFLARHHVRAVLHFAGRSIVTESVADPRRYFEGNVVATHSLLDAVLDAGIREFVFSSSAAVYGSPERTPIDEQHPTRPLNPYGTTKLVVEQMLAAYKVAYGLGYVALRYFNAAGADASAGLGERHDPETHVIPRLLRAAAGSGEVVIHGTDYPTDDGTCVRDYIHVRDLATAHVAAIDHLERGGEGGAINLGTGRGYSVRALVDVVAQVTGRAFAVTEGPRRAGDPAVLVADATKAGRVLGFRAERSSIERIVRDAWDFERAR